MTWNIRLLGRSGRWIIGLAAMASMVACAQIVGLTGDYHEGPQVGDGGGNAQGGDDIPLGTAGKNSAGGAHAGGAHSGGATSMPDAGSAGEEAEGGGSNPSGGTGGGTTPSGGTGGKPAAGGGGAGGAPASGGGGATSVGGGGAGTAGAGAAGAPPVNYGGVIGLEDLSTVKASSGCNKDATAAYPGIANGVWQPVDAHNYMSGFTIPIVTPANHPLTTIAGMTLQRRYFIRLPTGYDKTKPYKVLYEGAGCTGKGTDVPDFSSVTSGTAIMVAIEIYPGVWGGGAGPDGGASSGVSCFDEKRGSPSIEIPFIEALHARLKSQLCIDEHRVFFAGHSSGSWIGNQFGNSYGSQIFRAVALSSGGLPQGAQQFPTNGLPVPGIWWAQPNDGTNPFQGTKDAINHALVVNKCTVTGYDTSPTQAAPYDNVTVCKKFTSCPSQFPITVCTPPGTDHSNSLDNPSNKAATWAFLSAF